MSDMLTEPIEKKASIEMTPEIKKIALEEFHKEACARGYTCSLEEAEQAIEKVADIDGRDIGALLIAGPYGLAGKRQREAGDDLKKTMLTTGGVGAGLGAISGGLRGSGGGAKGILLGALGGIVGGGLGGATMGGLGRLWGKSPEDKELEERLKLELLKKKLGN